MGLFDGIKKLFLGAKLQETNLPAVSGANLTIKTLQSRYLNKF